MSRAVLILLFCCLQTALAWPPSEFAQGKFESGFLAAGGRTDFTGGTVGIPPGLMSFYNLDTVAFATDGRLIDSISGHDLYPTNNRGDAVSTTLTIGHIGFACSEERSSSPFYPDPESLTSSAFDFAGKSFTVLLWSKPITGGGSRLVQNRNVTTDDQQWELVIGNDNSVRFSLFYPPFFSDERDLMRAPLTFSLPYQYHRFAMWYDSVNHQIGLQVDNETATNTSAPGTLGSIGPCNFILGDGGSGWAMDEVQVWTNTVLSSNDLFLDWNDGIGTTYPTPGTPLQRLTGYETNLLHYFTFSGDGFGNTNWGGNQAYLFPISGSFNIVSWGKFGEALALTNKIAETQNDSLPAPPPSYFDFSGNDFAVRCWFQYLSGHDPTGRLMDRTAGTDGWALDINDSSGSVLFTVHASGGDISVTNTVGMSPNVWHSIFFWHQSGTGIGVSVDNSTPATATGSGAMIAHKLIRFQIETNTLGYLDELAMWYKWTPANDSGMPALSKDFNSGAGRTFPIP